MLVNPSNVISGSQEQDAETAAQAKGADLTWATASAPVELHRAIQELASRRVDFFIVPADAMFLNERRRIAELELSVKLPIVYAFREHVVDGGLMSYGVDLRGQFRRAAAYVDKILRGTSPSDLPFEQPTTFELIVNLRTAKALGLTVPASLLARADEVIE
jgi:putative ABC transport system substrate-binding protein